MMSKQQKKDYVEEMKKVFTSNEAVMIAHYQGLNVNELDKIESLEELKVVELGHRVKLHKIKHIGFGIDTPEQVKLLEKRYYEN